MSIANSTEKSPRRTRADMRAETTERLIAVARRAFAEQGFAEVSLDAVSAEAGVTRGALHHHFSNKTGLFEAVLRKVDEEIEAAIDEVWAAEPDHWRAFCACFGRYLDEALDPSRRRILFRDALAVLGTEAFEILLNGGLHQIIAELKDLAASGRIGPLDAEATAYVLNGAVMNLAMWVAQAPAEEDRLPRAHEALQRLLAGLQAPAGGEVRPTS